MKKLIFTLFSLVLVTSVVFAQTIQRDKVVVEIGTGTWCPYCPGAAMGADDLVANGHDVAIIENHNGDDYTTAASNARNSYYNITGYPTAVFDGGSAYVGGSSSTSLYPQYLSRYNQKIAIPSSFSVDIQGSSSGLIDFNVDVTIEMVDNYTSNDIRLHCVVTESEIPEYWQGQSHLNFVNRMMLPNYSGIQLDFSGGDVIEQNYSFTLDPSWVGEHCELVIFLQDNTNKTILNASKRELIEFGNVNDYDASLSQVGNLPNESCVGTFEPSFTLRNNGNVDLTTLTIKYKVNESDWSTFNWTGNLAFLSEETVQLPAIEFTADDDNELIIYSENPNGNPDQYPLNDTIAHIVPGAGITPTTVNLFMRTDIHPEETSWEIVDDEGTVVFSGGPYSQSGQMVQETFELDGNQCYKFNFYDAGGDGLLNPGVFMLYHGTNVAILQGMGDFGSLMSTDFHTDDATSVSELPTEASISVYPNPFSNYTNIVLNTSVISNVKVNMYNILGELVYQSDEGIMASGEHRIRISSNDLKNGIYFVRLQINDKVYTERVTLAR